MFGLIPARAGTTTSPCCSPPRRRAHPRSRGDHPALMRSIITPPGSSPLARGPQQSLSLAVPAPGLIPARAGTTPGRSPQEPEPGAHPRSRGDHAHCSSAIVCAWGSSPLARGPHCCEGVRPVVPGLIPARAGTTGWIYRPAWPHGAHPRSRGDHCLPVHIAVVLAGSSPLARGPQFHRRKHRWKLGLIPARAGTTYRG